MSSHRVLKDVTFLVVLLSQADGVQRIAGNSYLNASGPLPLVQKHLDFLKKTFPIEKDYLKFLNSVQKVVNGWVPVTFKWWTPELKFWFAGQVAMRMVSTRWRPGKEPYMMELAQALYDVGQQFKPARTPAIEVLTLVARSPETLRKTYGMFLPSC